MYYTKETSIFLNGRFLKAAETGLDFFSQTLHYGYGVFEGIRAYQTENGPKIFKAKEHYERLQKGCESLGIPLNFSVDEMISASYQLLKKNKLSDAYIRPLVFTAPNMSLFPSKETSLMIAAWKWDNYFNHKLLDVCISEYQRPNPKSVHIESKASGHYVNSILATADAKTKGYDEAIMLDMHGNLAEASSANLFIEKNGKLYTPAKGHIMPGITRQTVLEICRVLDISVEECTLSAKDLFEADAAFLCGTAVEITGIQSIDRHQLPKPWSSSHGALIKDAYKAMVLDKTFDFTII